MEYVVDLDEMGLSDIYKVDVITAMCCEKYDANGERPKHAPKTH